MIKDNSTRLERNEQRKEPLKPCPFCGGDASEGSEMVDFGMNDFIYCQNCGSRAPDAVRWSQRSHGNGRMKFAAMVQRPVQVGESDFVQRRTTKIFDVETTTMKDMNEWAMKTLNMSHVWINDIIISELDE